MKGDLHTHSWLSDGSNPPERLFELAARAGLDYLAVTDHDRLEAPDRDLEAAQRRGVQAIWGTEVSAYDFQRKRRVHILCYLPKDPAPVRAICDRTSQKRLEAGREMARLVGERYGITLPDVEQAAVHSNSIFKQHIMQALMEAGYSTRMFGPLWQELFDTRTGSCVRSCPQPDVWEVLPVLRSSGGICVLAHPYTYNSIDLMEELISRGLLDGLEVWSSKSTPEQEAYLLSRAEEAGLIPTGGSDFHGSTASRVSPLGSAFTPERSIELLLRR